MPPAHTDAPAWLRLAAVTLLGSPLTEQAAIAPLKRRSTHETMGVGRLLLGALGPVAAVAMAFFLL